MKRVYSQHRRSDPGVESERHHAAHHLSAGESSGEEELKIAGNSLPEYAEHSRLDGHPVLEEACDRLFIYVLDVRGCWKLLGVAVLSSGEFTLTSCVDNIQGVRDSMLFEKVIKEGRNNYDGPPYLISRSSSSRGSVQ